MEVSRWFGKSDLKAKYSLMLWLLWPSVLCQTLLPAARLSWLIPREIMQGLGSQCWTAGFALRLISLPGFCGCKCAKQDFIGPKANRLEVAILGQWLYVFCYPDYSKNVEMEVSAWGHVLLKPALLSFTCEVTVLQVQTRSIVQDSCK